jgi:hypothetical protein
MENIFVQVKTVSLDYKKLLKFLVPLCSLFLIVIIIAVVIAVGSVYGEAKDMVFFNAAGKTIIAYDNGSRGEIDGVMQDFQISLDASKAAVMTESGVLYYTNGAGNPVKVADDVFDFVLADSGNGLIYRTDFHRENQTAELHLFDGRNSCVIAERAFIRAAVSPDAQTVFYVVDGEGYVNGKALGITGIIPLAVSNGAEYLYYYRIKTDYHLQLTVQRGLDRESGVVLSDTDTEIGVLLNKDYSQMVFNTFCENPGAYISIGGGEAQMICGTPIERFIIPENAQNLFIRNSMIYVYGFRDFKNKAFLTNRSELYLLNRNLQTVSIAENARNITMTGNGRQIYYIDGDNLRLAGLFNAHRENPVIATNVGNYAIASGGNVYYVSYSNGLYLQGRNVAEEIISGSLRTSGCGTVFFLSEFSSSQGGSLFFMNGFVRNRVAGEVKMVVAYNNNVFYYVETDDWIFDVYRSSGNGRFELFLQEARFSMGRF